MPLYGHEIDATITPWEAGLDWIVKLEKGDFLGREALVKQKQQGITRKLIGFEVKGRGIARDGYEILASGVGIGLGDQRRTGARIKQKHRNVLSSTAAGRARQRHRNLGARPRRGSRHHPDAFL